MHMCTLSHSHTHTYTQSKKKKIKGKVTHKWMLLQTYWKAVPNSPLLEHFWKTLQLNIKIKIHEHMQKENNIKPLLKIESQILFKQNPRPSAGSFKGNFGRIDFTIYLLWIFITNHEKRNTLWSMGKTSQVYTKGFYNFTLMISISRVWELIRYSGVKQDFFQCVTTQYIPFKKDWRLH